MFSLWRTTESPKLHRNARINNLKSLKGTVGNRVRGIKSFFISVQISLWFLEYKSRIIVRIILKQRGITLAID